MNPAKELLPIGKIPEIGNAPNKMYAQVIRSHRMGNPKLAFQTEIISTPVSISIMFGRQLGNQLM